MVLSLVLARGIAIVPTRQNRPPFSSLQHETLLFSLHLVPLNGLLDTTVSTVPFIAKCKLAHGTRSSLGYVSAFPR